MSRQQASNQYGRALKAGQKYHHACVSRGEYPYTKVLSDVSVNMWLPVRWMSVWLIFPWN